MNDQDLVKALRCISTAGGKEKENITLGGAVKLATMYHGGLGLETLVEWPSANVTHWPPLPKAGGERMKVYLAGKITGDPNYREKFAAAAKKLEERAGVTVISPAVTPEGLKKADYMRICFAMLESADTAAFLPDWEDSPGAQLEKHWCEYVGKKMVFLMEGTE